MTELPFARVDPATTRVMVIDVQNDFVADGGWFANHGEDLTPMREAIDRTVAFVAVARSAGVKPIWVQATYDLKYLSAPMLERHELVGLDTNHCVTGTWGADFFVVEPQPGDDIVVKHRYSAFVGTELESLLRAQGVRNLIFTGITTNVCVESTARDAYMRDYHVMVVSDCTASYSDAPHLATLANIRRAFGRVVTADEVTEVWRGAGLLPAPVAAQA